MGLINLFKKELSTVVEWKDPSPSLLFHKADTPTDEIRNASKLIVAPGQGCLLVYEGRVEDVLTIPGLYDLETDNIPFVTTLLKLRQAFESEHKMCLYFFRTAESLNQPWGTATPVKYLDPLYKIPVELGAHGNYSMKIVRAQDLFAELIGVRDEFTTSDMQEVLSGRIAPSMTSLLAGAKFSYREIDAHLSELSEQTGALLAETFAVLGVELTDFRIEATVFDEATRERIGRIADLTTESLAAAEVGLDYVQLEKLRALRDAARNEGGLAGAGLQVGAGFELSRSLMQQKDGILAAGAAPDDAMTQLRKLKMLLDEQILTQEEFDTRKKDLLEKL
jgi:membrane protease subunit (stomatin/prohibitin family)